MFISDFVRALNESLELNDKVVSALTDIILSSKSSTVIENTPPSQSEYFHQKGTSYLYNREPVSSDMFDGEAGSIANKVPYPVIDDFSLGEAPDLLNGRLADKIVTLSSINDTTRMVLGTLTGVLGEYDDVIRKNELSTKSKTWKKFKIGEYWPMSEGFSLNADNNSTSKKITELLYHTESKYAFIKLNPSKDVKFHYMTIDVTVISDMDIPAIFVVLDSIDARDGDQFEFRVIFKTPTDYSSQAKWPEVLFFDGSDNSNGVPEPSIVKDYEHNESQRAHSIKIDGTDFYYVTANNLPNATKVKYGLSDDDRVFVSSAELNSKIINRFGEYDTIRLDSLKGSKYFGYGILEDKYIKTYKNDELLITSEVVEDVDGVESQALSFQQQQQKFTRKNTLKSMNDCIRFGGLVGSSVFYGRPSSFFKPKIPNKVGGYDYSKVEYYCDPLEGIDGNVPLQYNIQKFNGYINNPDHNGIIFEYELNPSALNGNNIALRLGIFESSLGLTVQFIDNNMIISFAGVESDTSFTKTFSSSVKCMVGFINTNGTLYATYSIKDSTIIKTWTVKCSSSSYVDSLLASRFNNVSPVDSTKQIYLSEDSIYDYWKPVISTVIDGSTATGDATIDFKNINVKYGLSKEEFESINVRFNKTEDFIESDNLYFPSYSSVRGVLSPIVYKPSDIKGLLCIVDANGKNTYKSNNVQNDAEFNLKGNISFRVGFTYNTYKGKVYSDSHIEYNPIVQAKRWIPQEDSTKVKELISNEVLNVVEPTVLNDLANVDKSQNIANTPGRHELYVYPVVDEISAAETIQIDNIAAKFGWKVTTYYQSIG